MQLIRSATHVFWLLALLIMAACSRAPQPEPPPPPPAPETTPTTFTITATNEVVASEALPTTGQSQLVRADFNADKLDDVAISEQDTDGQNVVSIYLQKRDDDPRQLFYRAGGIRQTGEYTISALMSSAQEGHADLLVIFKFGDGRKELVHFRSSGTAFTEIMRKPIASVAPTAIPSAPAP
ncbi:MAG: hypothetical protein K8T26_12135 [Lentisphaerae bacterium]|nr:hypothetical protein [Lentisphaerota bacterium]